MKNSFFVPREEMEGSRKGAAMNGSEGVNVYAIADPCVKKLLPPPLELTDPDHPLCIMYIVNIAEPSFGPRYMEGGIGVLAKYGDKDGLYYFSLQLSGPSAQMAAFTGRESCGLPKKLCDRILVERADTHARALIERNGVRLIDVEMEIGQYNDPTFRQPQENCRNVAGGIMTDGGCLNLVYNSNDGFQDMALMYYDSPTRYYKWDSATATVKLASSVNDPWGEIPIVSILGAAWTKSDNTFRGQSVLYRHPQDAVMDTMQYLYAGRYDLGLLCGEHQIYETK